MASYYLHVTLMACPMPMAQTRTASAAGATEAAAVAEAAAAKEAKSARSKKATPPTKAPPSARAGAKKVGAGAACACVQTGSKAASAGLPHVAGSQTLPNAPTGTSARAGKEHRQGQGTLPTLTQLTQASAPPKSRAAALAALKEAWLQESQTEDPGVALKVGGVWVT